MIINIIKTIKEKIEDKMYLLRNKNALSKSSYNEFLDREEVSQDLSKFAKVKVKETNG